jgi:hypothetical protein
MTNIILYKAYTTNPSSKNYTNILVVMRNI